MEKIQKKSEELWEIFTKLIPAAILISRAVDGIIIFHNEFFGVIFGLSNYNFIGFPTSNFYFSPQEYEFLLANFYEEAMRPNSKKKQTFDCEVYLKKIDGTPFWAKVSMSYIKFNGETAILSVLSPSLEDTLIQRSLQKKALIFEYLYDGVILTDTQGNIVDWNSAATRMFGYSKTEVLGKSPAILHKPEIASVLTKEIIERIKVNDKWIGEINFIRKDGSEGICETTVVPILDQQNQMVGSIGVNRDITQQKRAQEFALQQAEAALKESEERYHRLVKNSPEAIAVNYMEKIVYINAAGAKLFGANCPDEIIGQLLRKFIPSELIETEKQRLQQVQEQGMETHLQEEKLIKLNGEIIDVEIVRIPYTYDGKATTQIIIKDITNRKKTQAQLVYDALHDTLTGLPNRALFFNRLKLALCRSRKQPNYQFNVLFLDLDRFKVINDSLGHTIGDRLLIEISKRLQNCIKASDTLARLGGDEFTILLESPSDLQDATKLAGRIHQELVRPIYLEGHEIFTTASIGIVTNRRNFIGDIDENHPLICPLYNKPEDLLRDADIAMYRAKALGKARHEVFDLTMHREAISLLELENDLRRAIEIIKQNPVNSQFLLNYQPIICLNTGIITGFESLLRWAHPTRGLIYPGQFIPLAEETGLIVPLGMWILRSVCHQLTTWQQECSTKDDSGCYMYSSYQFPSDNFTVSVNLSSKHLSQPNLLEEVNTILEETNCQPSYLKLEITETLIMENVSLATQILNKLKNKNIKLLIDDFGTGYSSLSYLHQFPIDSIKIDRSFVSRLDSDTSGQTCKIVGAIIGLANNLGLEIIAEGIETRTQMQKLKKLQCNKGQGYLFSKPLEGEDATKLLRNFKFQV